MAMNGAVETWTVHKPAVEAAGGLVASQHYAASEVGARVLAGGGNAVDAAAAASFAIGAVEPWMSGLGGGGFMLVYLAKERRTQAIDFSMVAPAALDPADYPLAEGEGPDLFTWPAVADDRNIKGYHAMAVPGQVAGLALALERFGTRGWDETLAPAIEIAEAGMAVDWYATLKITTAARDLAGYAESKRVYLPDGFPPVGEWGGPLPRIHLGRLAATLRRLTEAGPRDFYEGEIARAVAADVAAGGGKLALADLESYQASLAPASTARYRDATVHVAPGLTAGPTLHQALAALATRLSPDTSPDDAAFGAYTQCLLEAYADRLANMGDSGESTRPTCTTHISVVDAEGNMVALTQTLLSLFGARVMLPETGILMNNGIMWFDPRPGRPNSITPGRRPLTNMCPTVVERGDGFRFAIGASGGRRIMPAVFQLVSFLVDYRMDMDAAFHHPRLDVSGTEVVTIDERMSADVIASLAARFDVDVGPNGVYPALFACPNAVGHDTGSGRNVGAAFVLSPSAAVSAEGGRR
jgi:gamma-glutamyltranspeptidase/glutathione hydrolase